MRKNIDEEALARDIGDGLVGLCVLDHDFSGTPESQAKAIVDGRGFICGLSSTGRHRPCVTGCPSRSDEQSIASQPIPPCEH